MNVALFVNTHPPNLTCNHPNEANEDYASFYFANPRDEVVAFLPSAVHRVLEVGCGNGAFRGHFSADTEYWGIEPEAGPAADAATRLTEVLHGDFETCLPKLPRAYFDLIVCNDVIEHMRDYRSFFREVQSLMVPGGVLVGSVPNVRLLSNLARLLIKRDWAYIDSGILDYTHLHFFTKKSLRRELTMAGFQIEKLAGINALGKNELGMRGLFKRGISSAASILIGRDTQFVQFAFSLRVLPDASHAIRDHFVA